MHLKGESQQVTMASSKRRFQVFSMTKMGRRRPKKSQTRIWEVWEEPRPLCMLFKASTPLVATNPRQHTLSGHWGFLSPPAQLHMFLTIKFEKREVSTNFGAKILVVFVVTVVHKRFRSKSIRLRIFCTNRDHTKPTLRQIIFAHLIHHFGISWTSLSKPDSPGLGVDSAPIIKTYNGIVPRPFPITNSNPSSMVWRSQQSIPIRNLFQSTDRFSQ